MGGPTRVELMDRCLSDPVFAREALAHPDWNVRFAAAVAAGRDRDASALAGLAALLAAEDGQPLYTQPPVRYEDSGDATEIAEQVRPLAASFPIEPDPLTREAWRRRGRLKQAALFAIADIGRADPGLVERVGRLAADEGEDYAVRMAACRCLGRVGGRGCLPVLEAAANLDEWCTAVEARKAIEAINARP